MRNINASPDMASYMALRPNEESLPWVFYDILAFAAGVAIPTTNLFFARAVNGDTITVEMTNLSTASKPVSTGQRFLAQAFGINVLPAAANVNPVTSGDIAVGAVTQLDDRAALMHRGYVQLRVLNQKTYLQGAPISLFPAGFGIWGTYGVSTTDGTTGLHGGIVNNGMPNVGNTWKLALPIPSETTVNAEIQFAPAFTPVSAVRIGCFLYGILYRAVQ